LIKSKIKVVISCGIPEFKSISRQKQLDLSTNLESEIYKGAMELIRANWREGKPIRLLTITGINLQNEDAEEQIDMFKMEDANHEKVEKFERAMDEIREKFGKASISFASVLDNDIGASIRRDDED